MKKSFFIILFIILIIYIIKFNNNIKIAFGIIKSSFYVINSCKFTDKDKIRKNTILGCKYLMDTCNIKVNCYGYKITDIPIIYVCNHSNWLDSVILKYLLPEVYTIAENNLKNYFLIKGYDNLFKKILDTWGVIFYNHESNKSGKKVRKKIINYINNQKSILLFPEGKIYATEGPRSFYPGSFELAFQNKILIQPITIKYISDITSALKDIPSESFPYKILKNIKKCQKQINNVNVTFHPLINHERFQDHLHMKKYCEILIKDEWINQHNYKKSILEL